MKAIAYRIMEIMFTRLDEAHVRKLSDIKYISSVQVNLVQEF